jgi:hypothetical protein
LKADLAKVEDSLQPAFEQWIASGLGDAATSSWTLLEPTALKAVSKAIFKPLGDGSYLVEGENSAQDTYTISAPVPHRRITALRLEALAHPSMKGRGPGRAENGNFGLGKIEVSLAGADGAASEVKIARAFADHEQNKANLSIAASLDTNPSSGWGHRWADRQGSCGSVRLRSAAESPARHDAHAEVELHGEHPAQHWPAAVRDHRRRRSAARWNALSDTVIRAIEHARSSTKLAETEAKALFDWWKQREKTWQTSNAKLTEHAAKKPNGKTTVMVCAEGYAPLVMHSQGPPFLEQTHILKRGDVNQKSELATQSFLQVLMRSDAQRWQWQPPSGAQYTGRRRSLANWLTDVDQGAGALLARVAVNRLWQHHFGRGLVATPNDFGRTGAQPSHPELLDWLAGELIRNGWHLKPIHRLIMTSAAYQQREAADPAKVAADPDNAMFLRHAPQRLEAEAVRDSALAVSGLMDCTMYGPGTLDENSKRRSIYFTVKRSKLLNSMVVFDAPEPAGEPGEPTDDDRGATGSAHDEQSAGTAVGGSVRASCGERDEVIRPRRTRSASVRAGARPRTAGSRVPRRGGVYRARRSALRIGRETGATNPRARGLLPDGSGAE